MHCLRGSFLSFHAAGKVLSDKLYCAVTKILLYIMMRFFHVKNKGYYPLFLI